MTNTTGNVDLDLNLRDLITIINDFQCSGAPVTAQSVISALVAASNAKRATNTLNAEPARPDLNAGHVRSTASNFENARRDRPMASRPAERAEGLPARRAAPAPQPHVGSAPQQKRPKFYAVIRGRQTGVFDDWDYVKELTDRIPSNYQREFRIEQRALDYYNEQKEAGKVEVIWLSKAEESHYGPMSVALF